METIEGQPLEPKACWLRARYVRARRVPGAMATALRGHSGPAQGSTDNEISILLRFLGATSEMVGLLKDKLPSGTGGSRMLKALEANAADQEAAALRLAEREAGIQAMAMSRQKVIETLAGKEKAILYHLDEHIPETIAKIGRNPETISYWRKELDKRLSEMEKLTGAQNLGAKTATEWKVKIGELRTRVNQVLGEE